MTDLIGRRKESAERMGEFFFEKLSDRGLLEELAQKDLEKLARVFKLVSELYKRSEAASVSRSDPFAELMRELETPPKAENAGESL